MEEVIIVLNCEFCYVRYLLVDKWGKRVLNIYVEYRENVKYLDYSKEISLNKVKYFCKEIIEWEMVDWIQIVEYFKR